MPDECFGQPFAAVVSAPHSSSTTYVPRYVNCLPAITIFFNEPLEVLIRTVFHVYSVDFMMAVLSITSDLDNIILVIAARHQGPHQFNFGRVTVIPVLVSLVSANVFDGHALHSI